MDGRRSCVGMMVVVALCIGVGLIMPSLVAAHCDTLDGPVVTAARAALTRGDVTPVLRWVQPKYESEIRAAFERTLRVRAKGPEARELADMYFFETLVRLHRAGEGAPYEGLKPAGTDLGPAVAGADRALASGSVDSLVKLVTESVAEGIRHRFANAMAKKSHADESVEAGREFVEAYVEFVHYVERLHLDAVGRGLPHGEAEGAETHGGHEHE